MFYLIKEDRISKVLEKEFQKASEGIAVLTLEEWNASLKWKEYFHIWAPMETVRFCKVENFGESLLLTFCVPPKREGEKEETFSLFFQAKHCVFVDAQEWVQEKINKITPGRVQSEYTLARFLYDFLMRTIEEDFSFLEKVEKEISKMEEDAFDGKIQHFNYRILRIRKVISSFYHYYSQLIEMSEDLIRDENALFRKEDISNYERFREKSTRLFSETQLLREYAMEVQEVYQSEISIRQNDIMKMLTIVTTIFLPLTLIAGWYGMNFTYMPELREPYSYPVVIVICILIVIFSLYFFKKKKYW